MSVRDAEQVASGPALAADQLKPEPFTTTLVRYQRRRATAEEVSLEFLSSVLYCRRLSKPGFSCVGLPGHGFAVMYSSLLTLAVTEGPCDWFSWIGSELLRLVPEGYGVVLDLGSAHELRLPFWGVHGNVREAAAR